MITTLTMLIALFTGVGAYFTFKMWKEKHEANIEIRLDSHPIYYSLINICVENHGPGNARDLKFRLQPTTTGEMFDHPIESLGFIKYGIGCLNSGTRRESMLTSVIGRFEQQKKYPIEVEVTYRNLTRNSLRKSRKKKFILDFREFDLISPVPGSAKYLQDISETLEKTEKHLSKFIGSSGVPLITVQSRVDANIKGWIWPFLSHNAIDDIPINIQRKYIQEILNAIQHNPWSEIYTELSKLPPEIQRKILVELRSKFAGWRNNHENFS